MSNPGAWVRIDAIDAGEEAHGTHDVRGTFVVVGGDPALARPLGDAPETLRVHASIAAAAERALGLGATVHAHTGVLDDPRHVAYALAIKGDEFAFLGDCQEKQLTRPIEARLGDGATARLRALVGTTSAELRAALLPPRPTSSAPPRLNPEVTDPEVLARLDTGLFRVVAPESWRGQYTVCTHIDEGWADCIDLAARSTAGISVNYYVNPADPDLEVWLLDADGTVTRPVLRLATLDLAALAERDRIDLGKPGINVTVRLAESPSLVEVVADHGKAADAVAEAHLSYD